MNSINILFILFVYVCIYIIYQCICTNLILTTIYILQVKKQYAERKNKWLTLCNLVENDNLNKEYSLLRGSTGEIDSAKNWLMITNCKTCKLRSVW
jgi:hypothetical protein